MFSYLYVCLRQYPKSEKHTLVAETKDAAYTLLRFLVAANKRYHKKTTLQDADISLEMLRYYIRLGKDLGFLPTSKYENLSKMTTEIGCMLGGWIRSNA